MNAGGRLGLAMLLLVAACGGDDNGARDMAMIDPLVAARPYELVKPPGYDESHAWPLLVVLHGYGANGVLEDVYLGLSGAADKQGYFVAIPDGLVDPMGNHYWNATDACCDLFGSGVDDVAYLSALIEDAGHRYKIDPKRVYLFGHSNGAFMAHRMACDRADLIAGFISLAGDVYKDTTKCHPSQHVAMVQLHGDADADIHYDGGRVPVPTEQPYPSAEDSFAYWSSAGGCTGTTDGGTLDLEVTLAGAETAVTRATGCAPGAAAELWRIRGGSHIPSWTTTFVSTVYDFFGAHARP